MTQNDNKQECPACYGMGTIEHARCRGMGCDGCEDGELICNKCNGFGFINDYDDDEIDSINDDEDDDNINDTIESEDEDDERE